MSQPLDTPAELSMPPSVDYENVLGSGAFGHVVGGRWNKFDVAIKIVQDTASVMSEIRYFANAQIHPHICHFYGWFRDTKDTVGIVMEVCTIDLFDLLMYRSTPLDESSARDLLRGVVDALVFLHEKHMVHCDLKLENCIVSADGRVKLIDFGLINQKRSGSPCYASPDMLEGQTPRPQSDAWSFAILLFACLNLFFPFHQATAQDPCFSRLFEHQAAARQTPTVDLILSFYKRPNTTRSSKLIDLFENTLVIDPDMRFTMWEVKHSMWFAVQDDVIIE